MRLCRCGAIVEDRCARCQPASQHKQTTKQRGYGSDHRRASEVYRAEHPLCEACVMHSVIGAQSTADLHHIHSIADRPDLRMHRSNWLALCKTHHTQLESDVQTAQRVKAWSIQHYEQALSMSEITQPVMTVPDTAICRRIHYQSSGAVGVSEAAPPRRTTRRVLAS